MTPIRVVLADDHALVRAGIRLLLEKTPGIAVVGEAGDSAAALDLVRTLAPDVLLTDIAMGAGNGLALTAQVTRDFPAVKVVILSMHAHEAYVHEALKSGAVGYLLKDAAVAELRDALLAVTQGAVYLSPLISRQVIDAYAGRSAGTVPTADILTPRQREVLRLIVEGHSSKTIAGLLGISVKTVETHRAQVMARLGIRDVAGLVKFAIRAGLVQPGS